jgi:hypothetical protein
MKKVENFTKKGIQALNKEEANIIKGGSSTGNWQWVFFQPTYSWMYVNMAGIGG